MARKLLLTLAAFAAAGACALFAGFALECESGLHALGEDALCPVAECGGECHGYDDVPEPNGDFLMGCPEVGCEDPRCHAWDTLQSHYRQASNASLNIWILAPTVLVVVLMALVKALSKTKGGDE